MIDLAAIFGDSPMLSTVNTATDTMIDEMAVAMAAAPVPTETTSAPEPSADKLFGLDDWVWRPDHAGVLGLERPGIPETERWWAKCSFDDLPEPPIGFCLGGLKESTL